MIFLQNSKKKNIHKQLSHSRLQNTFLKTLFNLEESDSSTLAVKLKKGVCPQHRLGDGKVKLKSISR